MRASTNTAALPAARPARRRGGDGAGKAAGGGPVQARATRTRDSLLAAAAEVFDTRGYNAATVDEIAARATATKGALYFHFDSKAALAQAVVARQHAAWAELAEASQDWGLNALDTIERIVREVTRSYQSDAIVRAGVRLANEQPQIEAELDTPFIGWIQRLTTLLRRGQRDGSVAAGVNSAAAARAVVASFYGVQEVSDRLTGRDDLERRVREWWALTRPGLAARDSQP